MEKSKLVLSFDPNNTIFVIVAFAATYYANNGGLSTAILSNDVINVIMQLSLLVISLFCVLQGRLIDRSEFNIWIYLSILFIIILPRSGWSVYSIIRYLSILLFCIACITSDKTFKYTIRLLKISYLIYALFTFIEFFDRGFYISNVYTLFDDTTGVLINAYTNGQMAGITGHISSNGMFLTCGLLIFITQYFANRRNKDLIVSIIFLIALLLTGKRGPIIFMAAALFILYYISLSGQRVANRLVKILGAIIFTLVIGYIIMRTIPALSIVAERFLNVLDGDDTSTSIRFSLWELAINAFKENPIFGIGWNQFYSTLSYQVGSNREFEVHNVYLQLLCETGIVGFMIYLGWFIFVLRNAISTFKVVKENFVDLKDLQYIAFATVFQIFFLLYCFTGNPLYDWKMNVPYFLTCAIVFFYKNKYKNVEIGQCERTA